jgi:hypothetical protein
MTNEELIERLNKASEVINKASRSQGTFIVVNSKIADALENLDVKKYRKKKLKQLEKIMKENDNGQSDIRKD